MKNIFVEGIQGSGKSLLINNYKIFIKKACFVRATKQASKNPICSVFLTVPKHSPHILQRRLGIIRIAVDCHIVFL